MSAPSYSEYVATIRKEGEAILAAARYGVDEPVPTCGAWTVGNLLTHLGRVYNRAATVVSERLTSPQDFPPEPPEDLAAIRTAFDEAHAEAIAFLKAHPESVLTEACRYGRDARPETVGGIYFHLVEHEIGHRAMVRFKLRRLLGG